MYHTMVRELGSTARARARKARREALMLVPLLGGVLLAYRYRVDLFGLDMPVRVATVIALVILGWAFARDVGRAIGPVLFRRLDPGTAGTLGFLIRLFTILLTILVALRIAGLRPETLAVGGAFTAILLGLAAQQTIGNLIAGTVLLSARPFRVGDRVRFHSGMAAGRIEGTVAELGLLYTILTRGEDPIMIPNSLVLSSAIEPLREPAKVDLLARFPGDIKPSAVQALIQERITVATLDMPHIDLEEVDGDQVLVRISATPRRQEDGPKLADEVLSAVASSRNGG